MATERPIDTDSFDLSTPLETDFYQFVNGGWLEANPVPSDYPAWGAMYEVSVRNEELLKTILEDASSHVSPDGSAEQLVGDFYASGLDEAAIEEAGTTALDGLLADIAGLADVDDLRSCLIRLHRLGVRPFLGLGAQPDFEDPTRYLVYVGQAGLGLPEKDYYERDDDRSEAVREAYLAHVTGQLDNLDQGRGQSAESIFELERRLASSSYSPTQLRDLTLTLNRMTVDELDELMPNFGLSALLREHGVRAGTVSIDNPGFFRELDSILAETPFEVIREYLVWHTVKTFASSLPKRFEDESFAFYGRTLGGQQEPRPRWARILAAASSDIGEAVGQLYVEAAFGARAKQRCETMVANLVAAMRRSIETLDWMTDETRAAALTKVDNFTYKIGYPDVWRDYSKLAVEPDAFTANRMNAAEFEFERRMGRLDEPVDRTEWQMPPHIVNAYYNPLQNEIVFPAGILQPPLFNAEADDAVNYGGIGTVIGHEITHGFDDRGSQFDEVGVRRNWWTDQDREEFETRAQVLVDQFSQYEAVEGVNVNGQLTLGENIADLGGLAIAFDAFMHSGQADGPDIDGYTPLQRFFLAYGVIWRMNYTDEYIRLLVNVDSHSPNPFRVNGPLSNFGEFARVFDVPEGPMSRPQGERAKIW